MTKGTHQFVCGLADVRQVSWGVDPGRAMVVVTRRQEFWAVPLPDGGRATRVTAAVVQQQAQRACTSLVVESNILIYMNFI